jgi:resolvase-like protein
MSSHEATAPENRASPDSLSIRTSAKLQPHHRERMAIVYVRQSSPQQVVDHKESTARQYGLVDVAVALGWAPDRIEVIDEDQGHTASTSDGRHGFHRLLAEVGLDHVGIILGIELCRLARSNKDWAQLIELCGIFRTLLADQDGLYDPTEYNDRLLLGLRGMMSEAELHILRGDGGAFWLSRELIRRCRAVGEFLMPNVEGLPLPCSTPRSERNGSEACPIQSRQFTHFVVNGNRTKSDWQRSAASIQRQFVFIERAVG